MVTPPPPSAPHRCAARGHVAERLRCVHNTRVWWATAQQNHHGMSSSGRWGIPPPRLPAWKRTTCAARKGTSRQPPHDPPGYPTFRDYMLVRAVDIGMAGFWPEFLQTMRSLVRYRAQLHTYAARRAGDPWGRYGSRRRQGREQWQVWAAGGELPQACGQARGWARNSLQEGNSYECALWLVGNLAMMHSGRQLDRREADSLKKSVGREYRAHFDQAPPKVQRGWWHPKPGLQVTLGGLTPLGLAWYPPTDKPPRTDRQAPKTCRHFAAQTPKHALSQGVRSGTA